MRNDAELIGFKFLVLSTTFNGSENLTFVKIDIYHSSMTGRLSLEKNEGIFNSGKRWKALKIIFL